MKNAFVFISNRLWRKVAKYVNILDSSFISWKILHQNFATFGPYNGDLIKQQKRGICVIKFYIYYFRLYFNS